jgi:hypothetical protein
VTQPSPGQSAAAAQNYPNEIDPALEQKRVHLINIDRQKSLVSDTNKLLKLAGELDAEIKRGNSGALTAAQLRKLAEIEKLARSVKDKMSYPVEVAPAFRPTPPVF